METGFSALISCYSVDVSELVFKLYHQAQKLNVPFQIIIGDNNSPESSFTKANIKIAQLEGVAYFTLKQPVSRMDLRHQMAQQASYDWLLFIDGDSLAVKQNYLENYIEASHQNSIVCGGIAYQKNAPARANSLRWMYGLQTEQKLARQRQKQPYKFFSVFNLLINKYIYFQYFRPELIPKDVPENVALSFILYKNNIKPKHINNPLQHTGFETNNLYLKKVDKQTEQIFKFSNTYTQIRKTTMWGWAVFFSKFNIKKHRIELLHAHLLNPPLVPPHTTFMLQIYRCLILSRKIRVHNKGN